MNGVLFGRIFGLTPSPLEAQQTAMPRTSSHASRQSHSPRKKLPAAQSPSKPRRGWRFLFRSDSLSLNFVSTVAGPLARPQGSDRLSEPALLQRWFCEAGLPDLSHSLSKADLEAAKRLRESIYAIAATRQSRSKPNPKDIQRLNAAARSGAPVVRLAEDGFSTAPPDEADLSELLGLIAREAIELFSGPYRDRIRKCASPRCQVVFVDRSRSGNRRWCAMSPCGDQASAKSYRRRKKSEANAAVEPLQRFKQSAQ